MSHRSYPPSHFTPPPISPGVLRMFATPHSTKLAAIDPTVPPTRKRDAYEIERFPAVNNSVHLVGYDRNGEVMVEVRMPGHRFTERTMGRLRRWMMQEDDSAPDLQLSR